MGRTATRLALLLVLVAVCVVGTGGYSTISADRTLTVPVADDEPLVSVRACRLPPESTAPGASVANATRDPPPRLRLVVTNRYGRSIAVHVGRDARSESVVGTVGVGDRARFVVRVGRDTVRTERDAVAVRLTATDLRIELTVPVRRCGGRPSDPA